MVRYSVTPENPSKVAKARGSHLRMHFKHAREITTTIRGMALPKAKSFLEDVLEMKQAVPFTKYTGGVGRHAQLKNMKAPGSKCRWPQKATKVILDLLINAERNAETKGMDTDALVITHTQCNRAPPGRRRTYRAHGRINAYMSQPAHVEIMLGEKEETVAKAPREVKLSKKGLAKRRFVKVGGGAEA